MGTAGTPRARLEDAAPGAEATTDRATGNGSSAAAAGSGMATNGRHGDDPRATIENGSAPDRPEAAPARMEAALADPTLPEAEVGEPIPDIVIRRLPVYVRTLRDLRDRGVGSVSSDELADLIGVTAAQIRRDLSYFGRFGKQGKGYDTGFLADAIGRILGVDRQWDVALAGLGNLGRAIARYRGFGASSFDVVAVFDSHPERVGQAVGDLTVLPDDRITDVIRERGIRIGIVAVPASAAQGVADQMVAGGVRAILNYAPVVLKVPPGVTVREIDPVGALQSMTYYLDE